MIKWQFEIHLPKERRKSVLLLKKTRPNSWAKQVREIEWGHWTLDLMTF